MAKYVDLPYQTNPLSGLQGSTPILSFLQTWKGSSSDSRHAKLYCCCGQIITIITIILHLLLITATIVVFITTIKLFGICYIVTVTGCLLDSTFLSPTKVLTLSLSLSPPPPPHLSLSLALSLFVCLSVCLTFCLSDFLSV